MGEGALIDKSMVSYLIAVILILSSGVIPHADHRGV